MDIIKKLEVKKNLKLYSFIFYYLKYINYYQIIISIIVIINLRFSEVEDVLYFYSDNCSLNKPNNISFLRYKGMYYGLNTFSLIIFFLIKIFLKVMHNVSVLIYFIMIWFLMIFITFRSFLIILIYFKSINFIDYNLSNIWIYLIIESINTFIFITAIVFILFIYYKFNKDNSLKYYYKINFK